MDERILQAIKQMTEPTVQGENSALWLYLQWVVGKKPDLPERALADALLAHAERPAPYDMSICAKDAAVIYAYLGDEEGVARAASVASDVEIKLANVFLDLSRIATGIKSLKF